MTAIAVISLLLVAAITSWAVETRLRALYARPDAAAFRPVAEGTVWRQCDDTVCGHMTTRHLLQLDGGHRCEHSARHRGTVHFADTQGSAT